jgi:sec-independent protein translocase protein TatA
VNLGPLEIGLIVLAVLLLFGYKKLPDASRSIGRSLRIFKSEMKDLHGEPTVAEPASRPVEGEVVARPTDVPR